MFANAYQKGFICVFSSVGSRPLNLWGSEVKNGHIKRIVDQEVKSLVLEICGTNVATTYIYSPPNEKESLGIRLPYFIMVIKNLKRYFTFEIEILDDRDNRRRFRVSNYQSQTLVHTFTCHMPLGLNPGWNQVQFNLADFTRRAYGSSYMETRRVQIHANCRIRCVYFADKIYTEDELPPEFKLYMPIGDRKPQIPQKGTPLKDEDKPPSKEELAEETDIEEAVEELAEADVPKQEAREILDIITDLVMEKISAIPKEEEQEKPAEGADQQEEAAAEEDVEGAETTEDQTSIEAPTEDEQTEIASEAEDEATAEESEVAEMETPAEAAAEQPAEAAAEQPAEESAEDQADASAAETNVEA